MTANSIPGFTRESTSDRDNNFVSVLIYGDAGSGKTYSVRTLPEEGTVILMADRGAACLSDCDYEMYRAQSWGDCIKIKEELIRNQGERKTVVIDHLSFIADFLAEDILTNERPALMKKKTGGQTKSVVGVYDEVFTQQDWGLYKVKLKEYVSSFVKGFKGNVVFLCGAYQRGENQDGTGRKLPFPNIQGRFAYEIGSFFDIVLYQHAPGYIVAPGLKGMEKFEGKELNYPVWISSKSALKAHSLRGLPETPEVLKPDFTKILKNT